MAHYAILNNDNIVVDVIPGVDEDQTIAQEALIELINVYITGEKGWLGPFKLQTESLYPEFITSTGVGFIDFAFRIEATEKSIIAYNPEIHSGAYSTKILL